MRYMVFVKMREDVGDAPESLHATMGAEMGELFAAGSMVDAGVSRSPPSRLRSRCARARS